MITSRLLTLIIFLIPAISTGQVISDSLLATFYNKTISFYFADSAFDKHRGKFKTVLLQTDFDTTLLVKYLDKSKFTYFGGEINLHSVLEKPIKQNEGRIIYRIKHTIVRNDTIDFNIGGGTISSVTKRRIAIWAWCGGTMGYFPSARFIYDKVSKSWTLVTQKEIINSQRMQWNKE